MPATWVLKSIAILASSFVAGFVFYMVLSSLQKHERKQMMEDILGTVINFVIYIWVGKIVLNLPTMFGDPFAVLAYPSDSKAFYLATVLSVLHIALKAYKGRLNVWSHLHGLLYVLVGAMFTFEFIGMATDDGGQHWGSLTLLFVLLLLMVFLQNRMAKSLQVPLYMFIWGAGNLILSPSLSYVAVFDYMLAWWYFAAFAAGGAMMFVLSFRKRVSV